MKNIILLSQFFLFSLGTVTVSTGPKDERQQTPYRLSIEPRVLSISFHHLSNNWPPSLSIENIKSITYHIAAYGQNFTVDLRQHAVSVTKTTTRQMQCHFSGSINRKPNSVAHFNLCHGMNGIFYWDSREYYIEPTNISKSHPGFVSPGSRLLTHYIYYKSAKTKKPIFSCKLFEDTEESSYIPDKSHNHSPPILQRIKRSGDLNDDEGEHPFPLVDHEVVHEHIIELLVVVTSSLVKRFGKGLNEYILNNVAIATKMLRHPSIKASIAINVVDIIPLDREYERLNNLHNWGLLTQDAVVDRFCHWIRYKKKYAKYVWDSAILINDGSFSTYAIGITHLRSMCAINNCIAVVDRGFGTGFIIAHEIGHQMNAAHDFDGMSSCKRYESKDQDQIYNTMMSTSLYFEYYPFKWSECSEKLINAFLRSDDSWCLKKHNKNSVLFLHEHIYDYHKNFSAGQRYDLNTQCSLAFGEPSEHCNSVEHMQTCSSLYCNPKRVGLCMRSQSIVDDGTPCGVDKRCIYGKCIDKNIKVVPDDGGWSEFSDWSNCSRPCNGGIQSSKRLCNNPSPTLGGRYCVGAQVQIKSCNIHNCEHTVNIREEMCKKFDAKPYIPRIDEETVCRLICIKDNKAIKHDLVLTDGTPCYAHRTDMCVRSRCYKAGCDRVISSDKVYDQCHMCGGKNDTCTKVNKLFDGPKIISSGGMLVAFRLPKHITNVYIKKVSERFYPFSDEVFDDYQILLLIDHNTIIRRGESLEPFAGGELHYSGSNKREETYRITGLVEKEIAVLIRTENPFTVLKVPSVTYSYFISNDVAAPIKNMYSWNYEAVNRSYCHEQCYGTLQINSFCNRNIDKVKVNDKYCHSNEKPISKFKSCKLLCGYRWQKPSKDYIRSVDKNSCQVRCGDGNMMVYYPCHKRTVVRGLSVLWQLVTENHCYSAGLSNRPYKLVDCTGECNSLVWAYGSWNNCSVTCGSGFRHRTAICKDTKGQKWNQEECLKNLGEPEEKETCVAFSTCKEETHWIQSSWSICSKSCGAGQQTRAAACLRKKDLSTPDDISSDKILLEKEQVSDTLCLSYSDRPPTTRPCMIKRCYKWTLDEGGQCSVTCGVGSRVYNFVCSKFDQSQTVVDDRQCFENGIEKPASIRKSCTMNSCYKPKWIQFPWGKCSESCGKGIKLRQIRCGYKTTDNRTVWLRNDAPCRNESRPSVMENCQVNPCLGWKYGSWSQCQGLCLYGTQNRTLECIDQDSDKVLPPSSCDGQVQFPKTRKCLLTPLCGYWKVGDWSKCSVTCGLGTKTRSVQCNHINGTRSSDKTICRSAMPFDEVHCENVICKSKPFWWLMKTSQCYSYGCSPGVLYSDIRCVDEQFEILRDNICNEVRHPNYYVGCIKTECRQFFWRAEPWSKISCSSSSCMMTIRNRRVNCVDDYGNVYGSGHCDEMTKLDDWRLCASPRNCSAVPRSCKELKERHPDSTDGEYSLAIDLNWTYFIYCADMQTEHPNEYLTLKRPNYSRSSKYLSIAVNGTCTHQEEYEDHYSCPGCQIDGSLRSITYYNKVRVNMTDLSIDTLDNRYSTTIGTAYVPFGTAKDCSGSKTCPQGHFMIDLSGTEFSVSMRTVWNEIYHNYGYRIVRTKGSQIVKGWCGGKCSGCAPLPRLYIEPQMYGRDLEVKSYL